VQGSQRGFGSLIGSAKQILLAPIKIVRNELGKMNRPGF
jgi:hypothetical protein